MTAHLVQLEFGGEERTFRCLLGELRKIQAACDAGPSEIARRLAACVRIQRDAAKARTNILEQVLYGLGDWRIDDVREPILQGLIGGGMTPNEAGRLVRTWIDERGFRGLYENAELALTLIVAGCSEPEDYDAGESQGEATTSPTTSPAANGTSPPSTAPAAPSAQAPVTST